MLVVSDKVKIYMDEDGNVLNSTKSKQEAKLNELNDLMILI